MSTQPTTPDMIANGSVRVIAPELLLQLMRSGVPPTIIDVRERPQLQGCGSIEGARSYPLRQLKERVAELDCQRHTPVVVVSQTGSRARSAAVIFTLAGFTDVTALDGGLARWMELGYEVMRPSAMSLPAYRPSITPA